MKKVLINLLNIYILLFFILSPIVLAMLPVIPYMINESNSWSLWFMLISMPLAVVVSSKFWDLKFIDEHSIK